MNLQGKTALVTGGAVRMGRAICEALAARGCQLVIHYHHSAKQAVDLAASLERQGVRAWADKAELRSQRDCERLLARAWKQAGGLDVLINNAAVFHKDSLATCTEEKLLSELRVNLFAPLFLTRAFAARTKRGKVINLLDRRVASHEPGCLPYLLSKQALAALTQIAALELAPGITVNGVAPGAVLAPPGKGARYLHDHAGRVPLQRRVSAPDVAAAVVALLEMDAVTGQIMFVDGGQHLLGNGV